MMLLHLPATSWTYCATSAPSTCRAPETAAQLADELGLVVPALHVALGEHAAARVAGQLAADLDAPVLHERARLAFLAEAEAFERREQVHAEAVVGGEHVDVLRRDARHGIDLRGHVAMRRVIEILETRPQLRGVDVLLGPAEAAHHDGLLLQIPRHVGTAHDDRHAAVVDEAVVEEAQRLGDVRRLHVILDRQRLLHHGVGVHARVLAEGHGDRAELLVGGAVEELVALEEERVERALRRQAPRRVVEVRRDAAARHPGAAVGRVHRALRVAVDQGDGRAEPGVDGHGRFDDALGGVAAAAPARIQAPQLAGPLARQGGRRCRGRRCRPSSGPHRRARA